MVEALPPVGQLRRGRHTLSREEVRASQHARLLTAMSDVVGEKGYVATSVSDVVRRAGVSRETFYEQFTDKQACFLAALESVTELVLREVMAAAEEPGTPIERLERALNAYLERLSANPGGSRTFLVEVYAAGPRAGVVLARLQRRFSEAAATLFGATDDRDRFACDALVSAVISMATTRIAAGDPDVTDLAPHVLDLVERALAVRSSPR